MQLTEEEINHLLSMPDMNTMQGIRDYLILALLCRGISKPQIARLKAFDFSIEGECLVFNGKNGKVILPPSVSKAWAFYCHRLMKVLGSDYIKSKPVLISFSTNLLKSVKRDYGITPEAIQQIVAKYFRKAGIVKPPHASLFKQPKTTSELNPPKQFLPKAAPLSHSPLQGTRRNKRYRNKNRYAHNKHRLLESKFCLDANFLTSEGFFKAGRGGKGWTYRCTSKERGLMGEARVELIVASVRGELAVRVEPCRSLLANSATVRVEEEDCKLGGQRWWFFCPQCRRKVFTLFYHYIKGSWIEMSLACRRCHRLVYLSQARGANRVGVETFKQNKEQHRVVKSLWINVI